MFAKRWATGSQTVGSGSVRLMRYAHLRCDIWMDCWPELCRVMVCDEGSEDVHPISAIKTKIESGCCFAPLKLLSRCWVAMPRTASPLIHNIWLCWRFICVCARLSMTALSERSATHSIFIAKNERMFFFAVRQPLRSFSRSDGPEPLWAQLSTILHSFAVQISTQRAHRPAEDDERRERWYYKKW